MAALVDLVAYIDDDAPRKVVALGQLVVFDLLTLGWWDQARNVGRRVLVLARSNGLANTEVVGEHPRSHRRPIRGAKEPSLDRRDRRSHGTS